MKRLLSICVLIFFTSTASANWVGGISYTHLSVEQSGISVDQSGLSSSLGYQIPLEKAGLSLIPEIRIGQSMGSVSALHNGNRIKVRLESLTAISVRVQYQLSDEKVYYFVAPSYGLITYKLDRFLPCLLYTSPSPRDRG